MNPNVIREFGKAWQAARYGKADSEGAVLLFRKADGSLVATGQGYTNEFDSFTFKCNPAAIAIVHTHRNSVGAEPSAADRKVADRLGVPIFTITSRGMYVYDPEMKRVVKMQDGLDWLDASKWSTDHSPVIAPHGQSIDRRRIFPPTLPPTIVARQRRNPATALQLKTKYLEQKDPSGILE